MYFAAKLDTAARIITITAVSLITAVIFFLTVRFCELHHQRDFIMLAILLIMLPAIYSFMPQNYLLAAEGLCINLSLGRRCYVPLQEITDVQPLSFTEADIFVLCTRGVFGYLGYCRHAAAGLLRMHATERSRLLLVTVAGKGVVISPGDTARFIAEWKRLSGK